MPAVGLTNRLPRGQRSSRSRLPLSAAARAPLPEDRLQNVREAGLPRFHVASARTREVKNTPQNARPGAHNVLFGDSLTRRANVTIRWVAEYSGWHALKTSFSYGRRFRIDQSVETTILWK
jgi:hypothetical protein